MIFFLSDLSNVMWMVDAVRMQLDAWGGRTQTLYVNEL